MKYFPSSDKSKISTKLADTLATTLLSLALPLTSHTGQTSWMRLASPCSPLSWKATLTPSLQDPATCNPSKTQVCATHQSTTLSTTRTSWCQWTTAWTIQVQSRATWTMPNTKRRSNKLSTSMPRAMKQGREETTRQLLNTTVTLYKSCLTISKLFSTEVLLMIKLVNLKKQSMIILRQ